MQNWNEDLAAAFPDPDLQGIARRLLYYARYKPHSLKKVVAQVIDEAVQAIPAPEASGNTEESP